MGMVESSSSSSASRRSATPCRRRRQSMSPHGPKAPSRSTMVLGLMGAAQGAGLVGFEEEEDTVEEAEAAFRVFDSNGDGFIDAGELGSVLRSLGFAAGVGAVDCQSMIDPYDGNKDGRMNFQEFLASMERSSSL